MLAARRTHVNYVSEGQFTLSFDIPAPQNRSFIPTWRIAARRRRKSSRRPEAPHGLRDTSTRERTPDATLWLAEACAWTRHHHLWRPRRGDVDNPPTPTYAALESRGNAIKDDT